MNCKIPLVSQEHHIRNDVINGEHNMVLHHMGGVTLITIVSKGTMFQRIRVKMTH